MFWLLWIIFAPIFCLLLPTRIIGKKYFKSVKGEAALFSCNHQTYNDPIILKIRVSTKFKMVAKDSLFKTRFGRWFMHKMGAYSVNRGGNDIEMVKTTLKHLHNNEQVVIFPEGTRVKRGKSVDFKNGLVMFALKTDCYVIPSIFRKRTVPFNFNTLMIGKPFKFSDIEEFKGVKITKELLARASQILSEKMKYLKEISIKEYKKIVKLDFKKMA